MITPSMQPVIPRNEVKFHPHSFGDPAGRVFRWNGELYRGITAEKAPFYSRLFRDGVMQQLIARGLFVESELTDFALDGYAMVIHHRSVPFPSYPNEWCPAMFQDATRAVLDLGLELARHNLTLKDHHLWNLLFEGCHPVYVDLTSIVPAQANSCWPNYDKFSRYCLFPLLLMATGHERIARHLLPDYEGVQRPETEALTHDAARPLRKLVSYRLKHSSSQTDYLKELRGLIEQIEFPRRPTERTEQPAMLKSVLQELRPSSVLDIGDSPAVAGVDTVSFHADSARATQRYHEARKAQAPLLPLVMDFTKPTPSIGFGGHYSMAASERFQCDAVVAFDVVRRLVSERHLTLEQITEGIAAFSKRWTVVDLAPRESLEDFRGALRKKFRRVDLVAGTSVFVCEK